MPPKTLCRVLGLALLLAAPATAWAADEPATPAELADLAARERVVRERVDERLDAWMNAGAEGADVDLWIADRLRPRAALASRSADPAPPARLDASQASLASAGDTTCSQVGDTLECVLREGARP